MTASVFSARRRALTAALAAGMLSVALAGCGDDKPAFKGSDVTGTHLGRDMAMTDAAGQTRTLADYRGKVVVVYFGYTHCPDVCPTSMAELAQVMTQLQDDAKKVRVIMISVDPKRDTPAIVDHYAKAFNPSFIGLSGTPGQLAQTAKSFKAYYSKEPAKSPGQYAMDHSSMFYIIDQKGEARVIINSTVPPDVVANDIKLLL
jgi:protein SCO1/2